MSQVQLPSALFMIAFILGPMFEDNSLRFMFISRGSPELLLRSPICCVFAALTIISVLLIIRREIKIYYSSEKVIPITNKGFC